jgi:hypothetical protein
MRNRTGGGSGSVLVTGNAPGIPTGGELGDGGNTPARGRLSESYITHWQYTPYGAPQAAAVPLAPRAAMNPGVKIGQARPYVGSIDGAERFRENIVVVSLYLAAGWDTN